MKLSDYKKDFYQFSGKASDVARAATLAGIALIWVFRMDAKPLPTLPKELLIPAGLFALGLAVDLLHYVTAAVTWGLFHRHHEKKLVNPADDPELSHSPWFPRILFVLFTLKLICVMAGYGFVGKYVIGAWCSASP